MESKFDLRGFILEEKRKRIFEEESFPDDIEWLEQGSRIDHGGTSNQLDLPDSELEEYQVEMYGYSPTTREYYLGTAFASYGEVDKSSIEVERELTYSESESFNAYLGRKRRSREG